MPLSKGYDFIGELPRRLLRGDLPEEGVKEPAVEKKEEPAVEKKEEPVKKAPTVKKQVVKPAKPVVKEEPVEVPEETITLPEPIEVEEKEAPVTYIELDYNSIDRSNPKSSLPASENGNYIIVYTTDKCTYCDKLIAELKDKTEAYILVVIRCKHSSIDLFYNRFVYNFPSWVIISNNKVTRYGRGYYTLEKFKRML